MGIDLEVVLGNLISEFNSSSVSRVVPTTVPAAPGAGVMAEFTYCVGDPYAVVAHFETAEGGVSWTFARELLRDGLAESTGLGDVCVAPGHLGSIELTLTSPDGEVVLECEKAAVTQFVGECYLLVPDGAEAQHVQVESWISELIQSG